MYRAGNTDASYAHCLAPTFYVKCCCCCYRASGLSFLCCSLSISVFIVLFTTTTQPPCVVMVMLTIVGSNQYNKTSICHIYPKHATLRNKSKDWVAPSHENVRMGLSYRLFAR